jgi:glycosyltransferase 2 family protein
VRSILRFVPHFIVLAFVAWCAFALRGDLARLSVTPVLRSWDLVAVAAVLSLLNYALRIFRWRSYLARLGHPVPARFAALTFTAGFAYTLFPGKVGEMVRARYYLPLGVPLAAVTAAFFAERLMDLVAMIVLAALLFAGSLRYQGAIVSAAALVAAVLAALALPPWASFGNVVKSWTRIPAPLRAMALGLAAALAATRPLLRPAPLLLGLAVGLSAWGLEGLGFGVLSSMVAGVHVDMTSAVGIYAVAVLVGGLSFLPGGLGSTEAVMTTLLVNRGYAVPDALLVTLVCRLVTLWLAVCLGWVAVFMLRQRPAPAELPC